MSAFAIQGSHSDLPLEHVHCTVFVWRRCSRVPRVECDDCGELLDTVYKLQIHQLRAHKKGKLFSCHHCSFKSPRKKDVQGLSTKLICSAVYQLLLTKIS